MATTYRRGGAYVRNGKTHYRRGSTVQYTPTKIVAGVGGMTVVAGLFAVGAPMGLCVLGGLLGWAAITNHRQVRASATAARQRHAERAVERKKALLSVPKGGHARSRKPQPPRKPDPMFQPRDGHTPHVITLTRAQPGGWQAGDRQCSYHRTGYSPGCVGCEGAVSNKGLPIKHRLQRLVGARN